MPPMSPDPSLYKVTVPAPRLFTRLVNLVYRGSPSIVGILSSPMISS
jgi:hypothetical protein